MNYDMGKGVMLKGRGNENIYPVTASDLVYDPITKKNVKEDIEGKLGKSDAESIYLKKNEAPNFFLGKNDKAVDSLKADTAKIAESCTGNSETATKATQDASGNVITSTYSTKTDLSNYKYEVNSDLASHKDEVNSDLAGIRAIADESLETSKEAERVSYNAVNTATQAESKAETAKNAVATLSGLSNTTTAQQALADQVTQIEENKQNLLLVPSFELYKETNYEL